MKAKKDDSAARPSLTPQREAVLAVIRASDRHLTASEIYEAAQAVTPTISFATVYNSVRFLRDAGLIGEINFGDGASRYDRETKRHDHALCTRCGRLMDFDLPAAADLLRAAARRSRFKPESVHLTLRGICPACQ